MRIEQVIATCSFTSGLGARKIASRRLSYLKNNLSAVSTAVHALSAESAELHLLHQYQEQLSDFKKELGDVRQTLLSLGVEEGDELETSINAIDKVLFDCSLQLKKLLFTLPNPISDPLMESSATMNVQVFQTLRSWCISITHSKMVQQRRLLRACPDLETNMPRQSSV